MVWSFLLNCAAAIALPPPVLALCLNLHPRPLLGLVDSEPSRQVQIENVAVKLRFQIAAPDVLRAVNPMSLPRDLVTGGFCTTRSSSGFILRLLLHDLLERFMTVA